MRKTFRNLLNKRAKNALWVLVDSEYGDVKEAKAAHKAILKSIRTGNDDLAQELSQTYGKHCLNLARLEGASPSKPMQTELLEALGRDKAYAMMESLYVTPRWTVESLTNLGAVIPEKLPPITYSFKGMEHYVDSFCDEPNMIAPLLLASLEVGSMAWVDGYVAFSERLINLGKPALNNILVEVIGELFRDSGSVETISGIYTLPYIMSASFYTPEMHESFKAWHLENVHSRGEGTSRGSRDEVFMRAMLTSPVAKLMDTIEFARENDMTALVERLGSMKQVQESIKRSLITDYGWPDNLPDEWYMQVVTSKETSNV